MAAQCAIASSADTVDWKDVHDTVVRYLRHRTVDRECAGDLAQEVVLRLIDVRRTRQIGSIHAMAFRIADNLLVDRARQQSRMTEMPDEEIACGSPSAERVLASRQIVDIMSRALRSMPPLRREVIVRRRLHGQTCADIAADLSLSGAAVEKHIARGLTDLRAALERNGLSLKDLSA
ncbi:sigma-70 family RNA polymerase sigma factor [uncultured Sphingomonas sp.]|uniref:RNA polymerase sigma factor n=1 Tax=uncultured Sphingomonas sp. TaxID=158754 RepID=UPI0025F0B2A0|nr:sigma-70 family RNA polymerase sigma factor [uncultured Sphingomonas sp.]